MLSRVHKARNLLLPCNFGIEAAVVYLNGTETPYFHRKHSPFCTEVEGRRGEVMGTSS